MSDNKKVVTISYGTKFGIEIGLKPDKYVKIEEFGGGKISISIEDAREMAEDILKYAKDED